MGSLHAGHLSLVQRSVNENAFTLVSIFVNPLQFGPNEDFERYPRSIEKDSALIQEAFPGASLGIFCPSTQELYPEGDPFKITYLPTEKVLCDSFRPGHFTGVATVVLKLLNIAQANRAYFGEKDYQQFHVIRQMAKSFFHPTEIVSSPTIRDACGLALSSRNQYLEPAELTQCQKIVAEIHELALQMVEEQKEFSTQQRTFMENRNREGIEVDYFDLRTHDLEPVKTVAAKHRGELRLFWAYRTARTKTRIIDNMRLSDLLHEDTRG